ncbi:MAG: GIY-YIG nuclease family protein [Phycisphaerae bacterium]|nr:GIY-YIG nuclease family protein [Phycisphaerae bacterium]
MYVLENAAGRFYVGQTEDVELRVCRHNAPPENGRRYTAKHGPWRLVWSEEHGTRAEAMARERQIKSMKSARWIQEELLNR